MALGIFSGAGISGAEPSALPMGYKLRDEVLNACYSAAERITGVSDRSALAHVLASDWKLEYVIGRLVGTIGTDATTVLATLSVEVPNEAQMLLAVHLFGGGLQVTLNFDRGIELAYDLLRGAASLPARAPASYGRALMRWRAQLQRPAPPLAVVGTSDALKQWVFGRATPALIKLHGTLELDALGKLVPRDASVVDETQLMFLSNRQLEALDELAQSSDILVTGYSGNDIDCYEPLLERLKVGCFAWVAPNNQGVDARVRAIDPTQPTTGDASHWLRTTFGGHLPGWPNDPLPGPRWIDRFRNWEQNIRVSHGDFPLAEAFAWMLHDAREHDRAITLFEALIARNDLSHTRVRLANALYDRNASDDRRVAAGHYLRVALSRGRSGGLRTYALIRYGEAHRSEAMRGSPVALVRAIAAPMVALAAGPIDGASPAQRALARNVLGHLGLRLVEQIAPAAWGRPLLRWPVALACSLIAVSFESAHRLLRTDMNPVGNRSVFLQQQSIEAQALADLFCRRLPDPALRLKLEDLRRAYERMPDSRGVANIYGALALVAAATRQLSVADDYLSLAEQTYRRPDGTIDPSGRELVLRRRRLLAAVR